MPIIREGLTKYSNPNMFNIIRELLNRMYSATWGTYYKLLRVIKFVIDTKTSSLKVQPKLENNFGLNLKIFVTAIEQVVLK
jgi:hypothetical protein